MSANMQAKELKPELTTTPKIVEVESLFDRMRHVYDAISQRAHALFQGRGETEWRAIDDWLRAENELLHPLSVEMFESDGDVTVHVDVPGFKAEDISLSVEARKLTIAGKREETSERSKGTLVYKERSSNEFFRSLSLPADVEPGNAEATLSNGVLTLNLKKVAKEDAAKEPVEVPVKVEATDS